MDKSKTKYFISHSSKDKEIAKRFQKFLVAGADLKREEFFCSSKPGNDIPCGEDFVKYIKDNIETAKITFALFSQNYLNSNFSMLELGVSWALNIKVVPIIIKGVAFDGTTDLLRNNSAIKIDSAAGLNKIGQIIKEQSCCNINLPNWGDEEETFLNDISELLKIQKEPEKIDYQEYKKLETRLKELKEKNISLKKEINQNNEIIKQLSTAKTQEEKEQILIDNDLLTAFEKQRKTVISQLKHLPQCVQLAIFRDYRKDEDLRYREANESGGLQAAVDYEYLNESVEDSTYIYPLNKENEDIYDVLEAITKLEDIISALDEQTLKEFKKRYGTLSMTNKRFWEECLDTRF